MSGLLLLLWLSEMEGVGRDDGACVDDEVEVLEVTAFTFLLRWLEIR